MIQKGDTVRYLNAVGGGKVTRVEGRIAYVDDDGFETPVQVSDLVVVLPAGHTPDGPGRMMFDQKAFDVGRTDKREKPEPAVAPKVAAPAPAPEDFPIEETEYGDDMTVTLAFEPADIKRLSTTRIDALLVNDSNYFLTWQLLKRDAESGWTIVARGESAPNEVVTFGSYTQATIGEFERFVFQAIACKQDKPFEIKTPLSVSRKLDLTKFFKVHCFRPGAYFETPVIEVPLIAEKSRKK
jgi:hypothetical protein